MSDLGYRPRGTDGPLYSPQRDLAYFTPEALRGAIEKFMLHLSAFPDDQKWCQQLEISKEDVLAAFATISAAQKNFINALEPVKSLEEALDRHGFYSFPVEVRQYVYSLIGSMFFSAWFHSVRAVSFVGVSSPAESTMAGFSATVRSFAVGTAVDTAPDTKLEHLEFENNLLQTQLHTATTALSELKEEQQRLSARCSELEQRISNRCSSAFSSFIGYLTGNKKCRSTGCTKTRPCSGKKLASLLTALLGF